MKRNPSRRRRHVAHAAAPRRRRRRRLARNPSHRPRRSGGFTKRRTHKRRRTKRNPDSWSTVKSLFAVAMVGAPTLLVAGVLAPAIVPASVTEKPVWYGLGMTATGAGLGALLTKLGHPIIGAGVGLPLMFVGLYTTTLGTMAALAAPKAAPQVGTGTGAQAPNIGAIINQRRMGAVIAQGQGGGLPARSMNAVISRQMGAVPYGQSVVVPGRRSMGAVEAMVGDHRLRDVATRGQSSISSRLGL